MRAFQILSLAAAVAMIGSPAPAQVGPETGSVQATFRGAAPAGCRLSVPTAPTLQNAQVGTMSPGSADIAIQQMVGDDAVPVGATVVLVLPAICNQAHTLTLTSANGGMLGDSVQPAGSPFRSLLTYAVTVDWAGGQQVLQTSDQDLVLDRGDAAAGVVTVTIQIPEGGAPLAAGAYTDELVLELGAAG